MATPKVSVLMPVYNTELYVEEAIDSILAQTFKDFELIIINDGSSDSSEQKILKYSDERIRYIKNEENIKLIATLNKGIDLAKGEYIVRMDADDISLPDRILKQVEFMDTNPEIGVSGTWFRLLGTDEVIEHPVSDTQVRVKMFVNTPFAHPSVIIRKKVLTTHNLYYNKEYIHGEDYELWYQVSKVSKLANIPEVLLSYRVHDNQVTRKHPGENRTASDMVRIMQAEELVGAMTEDQKSVHIMTLVHDSMDHPSSSLRWLETLNSSNKKIGIYDRELFEELLSKYWTNIITKAPRYSIRMLFTYIKSPFRKYLDLNLKEHLKIIIKCLIQWKKK